MYLFAQGWVKRTNEASTCKRSFLQISVYGYDHCAAQKLLLLLNWTVDQQPLRPMTEAALDPRIAIGTSSKNIHNI